MIRKISAVLMCVCLLACCFAGCSDDPQTAETAGGLADSVNDYGFEVDDKFLIGYGLDYDGYYAVGKDWIGGIHFTKSHVLLEGLPVGGAMNWPYQAVVRNGDQCFGFRIKGEDMVVGSYRTTPFELGTSVGVIPCGKGRIIFSSLDIASNLDNSSGPAEVARKLLCNYIKFHRTCVK